MVSHGFHLVQDFVHPQSRGSTRSSRKGNLSKVSLGTWKRAKYSLSNDTGSASGSHFGPFGALSVYLRCTWNWTLQEPSWEGFWYCSRLKQNLSDSLGVQLPLELSRVAPLPNLASFASRTPELLVGSLGGSCRVPDISGRLDNRQEHLPKAHASSPPSADRDVSSSAPERLGCKIGRNNQTILLELRTPFGCVCRKGNQRHTPNNLETPPQIPGYQAA